MGEVETLVHAGGSIIDATYTVGGETSKLGVNWAEKVSGKTVGVVERLASLRGTLE